jgi:hypothetical protein
MRDDGTELDDGPSLALHAQLIRAILSDASSHAWWADASPLAPRRAHDGAFRPLEAWWLHDAPSPPALNTALDAEGDGAVVSAALALGDARLSRALRAAAGLAPMVAADYRGQRAALAVALESAHAAWVEDALAAPSAAPAAVPTGTEGLALWEKLGAEGAAEAAVSAEATAKVGAFLAAARACGAAIAKIATLWLATQVAFARPHLACAQDGADAEGAAAATGGDAEAREAEAVVA